MLYSNTIGDSNTAIGEGALSSSISGDRSTAVGAGALINTTASFNTALGYGTGPASNSSSNTTSLGYQATCTGGNMVRLGNSAVTSIGGYAGWTNISDARVKDDVRTDVPGLAFINQLRPVTYHLNVDRIAAHLNEDTHTDRNGNRVPRIKSPEELQARAEKSDVRYTGFIAQEVDAAAKATGFDFSGIDRAGGGDDLIGLRYAEFVVPLVKAVQEQQTQLDELRKEIEALRALVKDLMER
ncbi:MAG: tail fiber domain-containing protein [Flavobacteriales bacterium]|nr:tail fiber domain-containing protein [Flavobacteriales bacterium]